MKLLLTLLFLLLVPALHATETILTVRVRARDAKFVGSSIGGARIVVRDGHTGRILAEGLTQGSTGNTTLLMYTPQTRGMRLSDDQTAKFEARLDIDQPTLLTVEASAPASQLQAAIQVSTQLWLIPGKHLLGDGLVLEVPGFAVDVLSPRTHQSLSLQTLPDGQLLLQANIVMMCGCPIEEGGLWDASQMEVGALLRRNGEPVGDIRLQSTATNTFEARWKPSAPGLYEAWIYAYHPDNGNTGVDQVNFMISE